MMLFFHLICFDNNKIKNILWHNVKILEIEYNQLLENHFAYDLHSKRPI